MPTPYGSIPTLSDELSSYEYERFRYTITGRLDTLLTVQSPGSIELFLRGSRWCGIKADRGDQRCTLLSF